MASSATARGCGGCGPLTEEATKAGLAELECGLASRSEHINASAVLRRRISVYRDHEQSDPLAAAGSRKGLGRRGHQ